ncbi:MAG: hypothetical protein ACI865_002679, partial [Flavobacteriaceae bacterium]
MDNPNWDYTTVICNVVLRSRTKYYDSISIYF